MDRNPIDFTFVEFLERNSDFLLFNVLSYLTGSEKREDINFKIVNFPCLDSNIPKSPAYGIYTYQVKYAKICINKTLKQETSAYHQS